LIKAHYESVVSWKEEIDYIRCAASFHTRERKDAVIFRTVNGYAFGKLIMIFICQIGPSLKQYPICVIQRLEQPNTTSTRSAKDKDLGFCRLRCRPEDQVGAYEFIFARSIVRGALLVNDFEKQPPLDSLVLDLLDEDMFVRCQRIFSNHL
jgi:hypothetical protein